MDRSPSPTATPSTELERLLRVISSLPELELRVRWMREYLHGPPELCAFVLNRLCEDALDGASRAREGLLPLVLCLVQLVDWEGEREAPLRQRLRGAAQEHGRHALARLLRVGPPRDVEPSPEPEVPDYGFGRELTLGERRSLARRPTRSQLDRLLRDPHPLVLARVLACPQLTELDVLRQAGRRPAHRAALAELCRSVHWLSRSRVRLALAQQPACPSAVSVPLIHVCDRSAWASLARDPGLSPVVREVARSLFDASSSRLAQATAF